MKPVDALSFQLYSARALPTLQQQLQLVAGLGYRMVEPYAAQLADPPLLKDLLQGLRLSAPTAHVGLDRLRADAAGTARLCRSLSIGLILVPAPPPQERDKDMQGWRALGRELHGIGKAVRDEGLTLGWHNHHWEVGREENGPFPLDLLFEEAPELVWEADLAWLVRGGVDPLAWLAKHAGRIPAAHVKDLAPKGQATDEDGWADVGHGTLDWSALLPAMRRAGVELFVVEHDNPSDVARFARRSREAIAGWPDRPGHADHATGRTGTEP
ncbi:MAG: sugar phosphate isomerase/epimerase family protein [Hyphomicrobiales bacterium]